MITLTELEHLSIEKFEDAKVLEKANRYRSAFYICGYALECALKKRICITLGWKGYPHTKNEFKDLQSLKTHNLEILLRLSGVQNQIKSQFWNEWSVVTAWDTEIRYSTVLQTAQKASFMIQSTEILLRNL